MDKEFHAVSEDWSDQIFLTHTKTIVKTKRPQRAHAIAAARAFLEIYYSTREMSFQTRDVFLNLIGYMKIDNQYVIPNVFYNEESDDIGEIIELHKDFEATKLQENIGKDWYREMKINLYLQENETNNPTIDSCIYAIGYMALYSLRFMVKDENDVSQGFACKVVKTVCRFWRQYPVKFNCYYPSKHFINWIKSNLVKFQGLGQQLTIMVVEAYRAPHTDIKKTVRLLMMNAFLKATKEIGLGMLHWTYRACTFLGLKFETYVESIEFDLTRTSVTKLTKFVKEVVDVQEITWPWARLIQENALLDLTTNRNVLLTLIGAAIVANGDETSDIWKAPTINKLEFNEMKASAILIARDMLMLCGKKPANLGEI